MKKILTFVILTLALNAFTQLPNNGLVGYWPFNGNANDESGNGNNGTVNGAKLTSDRFGNENQSYLFNGTTDNIVMINKFFNIGQNFTLSEWFNCYDVSQCYQNFFNTIPHNGIGLDINRSCTNNGLTLWLNSNPDNVTWNMLVNQPTNYNHYISKQWYHVILQKEGNVYKIFINGVLDKTWNVSTSSDYNCGMYLGSISLKSEYFKGQIDDIRVYNRALNSSEISALYYENKCIKTIVNDTLIYHVSDVEYASISPISQFIKTDSLKTVNGSCDSIVNRYIKFVSNPTYCSFTDSIKVIQTVHVSVTDTLIIKAILTDIAAPNNTNTLKVYPNPAKDHITINFGDYAIMNGYTLKIVNTLGYTVFITAINQQTSFIDLNSWNGKGIYYVHLIDAQNKTIDIRQIVIE